MFHLENTFLELIQALEFSKPLKLDNRGFWSYDYNPLKWLYNKIYPDRQIQEVANACIENLQRVERIPIDMKNYQDVSHMFYQVVAQYLEKRLRKIPESEELIKKLMRLRAALEHRYGAKNGGASRMLMGYVEYRLLLEMARKWKKKQEFFCLKFLTQQDEQRLKFAAQYPLFVDLLLEFPTLQEKFFNWSLRDNNPVDVFIEFPSIADWVIDSDLSHRLGRIGDLIRLEKIGNEKHVTMMFEGRRISILDLDKVIEFRGGYRLSLREISHIFSQKFCEVGNLEVFKNGIVNWNTFEMGYWDETIRDYIMVDFVDDRWWEQLPHFETINHSEAEARYDMRIARGQWVVAAHATREYINLSYEKTHAFLQVAIPDENGNYRIYDFGKYGTRFPRNNLDVLKLFTQTMTAGVMYPDDNVYHTQRQHGYYPIPLDPNQGIFLMERLREEIMHCFAGLRVYQIESENCAKWTMEVLSDIIGPDNLPNLYQMSLLDCEPGGLIQNIFALIKRLPHWLHAFAITRLHYPIGAWRGVWIKDSKGLNWRSLSNHEFFKTAEVYLPALVIQKRQKGLFAIDTANLENKTFWSQICEKVLHRMRQPPSQEFRLKSKLAHDLLINLRCRVKTEAELEDKLNELERGLPSFSSA